MLIQTFWKGIFILKKFGSSKIKRTFAISFETGVPAEVEFLPRLTQKNEISENFAK